MYELLLRLLRLVNTCLEGFGTGSEILQTDHVQTLYELAQRQPKPPIRLASVVVVAEVASRVELAGSAGSREPRLPSVAF